MPDYNPSGGAGEGPMRRPVTRPRRRYGPGGLPTEGAEPAPKPWPFAPYLALLLVVGFLALQMWPASHYRHPHDPSRTWHPIPRHESGVTTEAYTVEMVRQQMSQWRKEPVDENDAPLVMEGTGETEFAAAEREAAALGRTGEHESEALRRRKSQDVHVYLSTDETDLRPLAVVINSTLSNAKHPDRIKFHLVIPASESKLEYYKLTSFFPSASIEIVSEGIDLAKVSKLIKYRKDSKAREDLKTPYNFLLYYLPHLLKDGDVDKLIYLDTDVVVKGDIEELYSKGLEGHPIAAVKDCSQNYKVYFDFEQLKEIQTREEGSKPWLPKEPFDEKECVFNRGALLINVREWIQQNVTEAIEWWMEEFNNANKVLYKYGLSQPPLLLTLYKNYKELEPAWNVRGLGRDQFSALEQDFAAEVYGHRPDKKPFLSMETEYAKILHFNGKFKPWRRDRVRLSTESLVSLCGQEGEECYKLWWEYLSPRADDAFKPTVKQPPNST